MAKPSSLPEKRPSPDDAGPGALSPAQSTLLAALADGPQAVSLFDPSDRLAYGNGAYREAWGVADGAHPSFASIMRSCFERSVGALIETADIEAWLARADRLRRRGAAFRAFEVDFCDGRWFWITERRLADGWILSIGQDITALKENEQVLRAARDLAVTTSITDPLTQLANRRSAMEQLSRLFAAGEPFHLALVDIDHFKRINDSFGHAAGDAVLVSVARRLERLGEAGCAVARLAGDEFAVIGPPGHDRAWFERLLRELTAAVARPFEAHGHTFRTGLSIGVAQAGRDGGDIGALLAAADAAMYEAKNSGRSTVRFYERRMGEARLAKAALGRSLPKALADNQLVPFYQPIVDLRTGLVRGLEALARWNHPARGLLAPTAFAAAFDDPKLAVAVDDFMLDAALADMRGWVESGLPVASVNVNASDAQLRRADLVPRITDLLARNRLTPDRLRIEVGETAFLGRNCEPVAEAVAALGALGVVCLLDDFGAGHASLSHLRQFRGGRVKVDRAFVANICSDPFDRGLVQGLIELGRNLDIRVTAEGVETGEQLALLRELGCACAQGYFIARPAAAADVPAAIMQWYARQDAKPGNAAPARRASAGEP
jgi:diguanylate cyclase (GGDEF)-like protein